jgi:hypothetical protein
MPEEFRYDDDETLKFTCDYTASNKGAGLFAIRITNKAFYRMKTKLFAVSDPYYFERILHEDIIRVMIVRRRQLGLWILSGLMIAAGALVVWAILNDSAGSAKGIGYGIASGVIGLIMPFVIRGRFVLIVESYKGRIKWVPPLVLDKPSKAEIDSIFTRIKVTSDELKLDVSDQRHPA